MCHYGFFYYRMLLINFIIDYVDQLSGVYSLFYLLFIWTDEIKRDICFTKDYYVKDSLDFLTNKWHNGC